MGILLDNKMPMLIQGITGREGSSRAAYMKEYGTNVVAGVTPGRGGDNVEGIPVYDTVAEAVRKQGHIEGSTIFVPGPFLKDAVFEALDNDIKFIVAPVERVPLQDILQMTALSKRCGARILGPGSIGIVTPGVAVAGWLGGNVKTARDLFVPGPVGVISRSGGQSGTVPWVLKDAGLGISTCVHVGTEPVTGISMGEVLELFEKDEQTKAVAAFGEIGGPHEEEAAETIKAGKYTKPFIIYIAGAWAPPGMRFSHASSIIEGGKGTAQSKIDALRNAGAYVVERPDQLASTTKRVLEDQKRR
jgi:succinyl-CoA synthetase alpha subunit